MENQETVAKKEGNLIFKKAEEVDIEGMLAIEKEYFGSYSRALDKESMTRWFRHNKDMFYVVKNNTGEVLASLLLIPVIKELYDKILVGQVSDLYDFKEEEVPKIFESDYFHLESICIREVSDSLSFIKVFKVLLQGTAKVIYENAKFVTTSPVTEKGRKMSKRIGFELVSEEEFEGKIYPVYHLSVTEEKYNKLASSMERGR